MKVGTDGVLLGAWARLLPSHQRILDIGTGTGLIALMAAQRTAEWRAQVVGVEIDPQAALDAAENVAASPWSSLVEIVPTDIELLDDDEKFDHILSNPPYFVDSLRSPDKARTTARHTDSLTFETLMKQGAKRLSTEGMLSIIIPCDVASDVILAAARCGLFLARHTTLRSKENLKPLRSLMEFGKKVQPTEHDTLTIHTAEGDYTAEYRALTREFYLNF